MGQLHQGWKVLGGHLGRERAGIAARSVGATQAVLDEAVEYARVREQFGQPIGKFQAVSHKLAEMAMGLHVARVATYDLARRDDAGEDIHHHLGHGQGLQHRDVQAGGRLREAFRVLGGAGYLRSSAMQRQYRDARLLTSGGGTTEVLFNVISRSLGL